MVSFIRLTVYYCNGKIKFLKITDNFSVTCVARNYQHQFMVVKIIASGRVFLWDTLSKISTISVLFAIITVYIYSVGVGECMCVCVCVCVCNDSWSLVRTYYPSRRTARVDEKQCTAIMLFACTTRQKGPAHIKVAGRLYVSTSDENRAEVMAWGSVCMCRDKRPCCIYTQIKQ